MLALILLPLCWGVGIALGLYQTSDWKLTRFNRSVYCIGCMGIIGCIASVLMLVCNAVGGA